MVKLQTERKHSSDKIGNGGEALWQHDPVFDGVLS